MSHELRSPLNAILGFAQLLATGVPAPTVAQKASIDQILRAGWYLLELINEILDLALVESGRLSLSLESVSLVEIMLECQDMIEPQAKKNEIVMSFPILDLAVVVHADRTRIKQVMINLLSNAVKYNRPNGTVELKCVEAGHRVRVSVHDTGEGLSPEKLANLFQPFNRLGQEASAEQGSGIGLVMSKRLVELMGGAIGVESVVGQGSIFWFELDLAATPPVPSEAPDLDHPSERQNHKLKPSIVLYVEDNQANLQLVEQLIGRRTDLSLLTAVEALAGIELARVRQPNLIILDINLPGLTGLEALRILREDPLTTHIPVLALSANAMPNDIQKGLAAGFLRYITKPIDVASFMASVDFALDHEGGSSR